MVCQPFELIDRLKDPLLYYLILFIRHQEVRKLGQLFSDLSSDHPMPSSSSVSRRYYINCFKISFYHPIPSALSVSSSCVNLVNCLKISHLIIPSHPVYPSSACTWTWSIVWMSLIRWTLWIVWIPLIWLSYPIIFFKISHLIIPSSSSFSSKYLNVSIKFCSCSW